MIATDYREGVLFPSATTLLHPDRRGAQGVACRRYISALITQSIALHYCRPRLGMAGVARLVGSFTGGRLGGWWWGEWQLLLHMHTLPCGYQMGLILTTPATNTSTQSHYAAAHPGLAAGPQGGRCEKVDYKP